MGGEGSGRKVDPNKAFLEQTPVGHTEGGTVIMPDYSGVSSHERTLTDFDARYSGAVALWDRTGTVLSPKTAGDNIETTGAGVFEGLTPYNNGTADLGSVPFKWRSLHLSEDATITGNITIGGTVDGIDIATDVAANTTHRGEDGSDHADVAALMSASGSYLTAETDPVFLALSGSLDYIPTGGETDPIFLALSGAFLTDESDPIFIATSGAFWQDATTDTGTNKTFDSFTNHIEADEVHEELRNETGSTINRGDAVYISGFSVGLTRALVTLADNSSPATMPAVAILESSSLANNATGHFIEIGSLTDVDTGEWNVGDDLYISGAVSTGNTLTNVKPTGANEQVQKVAVVLRSHASNGVLEIFGAGRTNDSPNSISITGDISGANLWGSGSISGASMFVGINPVLTSFTETDPVWLAQSGAYYLDVSGALVSGATVTNAGDIATNTADIIPISGATVQNTAVSVPEFNK